MSRPEDENYWTSSATRGFDFDSEDTPQDNVVELFGASRSQTAQLSKQVQQNIPQTNNTSHVKLSQSLSSLSSTSSTGGTVKISKPDKQCEVTNKLLSSTINVESVLTAKDVVRSIFLGLSFDLTSFKRLKDKAALLDEALKLGDGDVVTAVLLFLQKSLHQSALFPLLKERPVAALQYIDILEKQKLFKDAAALCNEMNRSKEATVHLYNQCLRENGNKNLLSALENLRKTDLKNMSGVDMEIDIVKEHVQLLERQLPIAMDSSHRSQGVEKVSVSPFIGPPVHSDGLVGSSLLATLQYCCRHHWGTAENLLASPSGFRKMFLLTDRQFVWNAVIGRLLCNSDPLPILLVKGMFGAPKLTAGISIPRLLEISSKMNASPALFDQLLPLIESSEEKCKLAKKYQRHRIVIDVLTSYKDRMGLLKYRDVLGDKGDIDYVNNILRVSSTRWKN